MRFDICFFIPTLQVAINEKCRKRAKRIAFYAIECRGACGEIFVDLQNYTYAQVHILYTDTDVNCIKLI